MRRLACQFRDSVDCSAHINSVSRRWARSRGSASKVRQVEEKPAQELFQPTAVAPSLRQPTGSASAAFATANTPTISSMRAEIESMRREKHFEESLRKEQIAAKAQHAKDGGNLQRGTNQFRQRTEMIVPATAPSYNVTDGAMGEALKANEWLIGRKLQRDISDVLRPKTSSSSSASSDSARLVELSGVLPAPHSLSAASTKIVEDLSRRVRTALQRYAPSTELSDVGVNDLLYTAAVVDVVQSASDADLRVWLRLGLIDPLWWGASDDFSESTLPDASSSSAASELLEEDSLDPLRAALLAGNCSAFVGAASERLKFGDLPPPDVAPAILKASRGDFGNISEKELRALEGYEKSSGPGQGIARSMSPSSPLLAELAKRDSSIKTSLDVMERVKREALLDKQFQEAVEHVNVLHEGRIASMEKLRPSPRPSAAAVPYFFGSQRSRPPPQADMNLPAPALSPGERQSLRRKKKLMLLRKRFSRS